MLKKNIINGLNIRNGKLSNNFFKIFLSNVLLNYSSNVNLSNLYDLRLITSAVRRQHSNNINQFNLHTNSTPNLLYVLHSKNLIKIDQNLPIYTQSRFSKDSFHMDLNNVFNLNVNVMDIPKTEEAGCIRTLRRNFHGKKFTNNLDLNNRINSFNQKMSRKYLELYDSIKTLG